MLRFSTICATCLCAHDLSTDQDTISRDLSIKAALISEDVSAGVPSPGQLSIKRSSSLHPPLGSVPSVCSSPSPPWPAREDVNAFTPSQKRKSRHLLTYLGHFLVRWQVLELKSVCFSSTKGELKKKIQQTQKHFYFVYFVHSFKCRFIVWLVYWLVF